MPVGIPITSRRTLLQIVQAFCRRTNLPVPSSVMGSTDPQIVQIMALLEEDGNDLESRGSWQGLTHEAVFTTVASELQGTMDTLAAPGFRSIKNETIWDRSSRLPIWGPLDGQEWQVRKAMVPTGPRYQFRIRNDSLYVQPAPTAGLAWAFEYVSQYWILSANGATLLETFGSDTDTVLLPHRLVLMGLRWRWKKEKGFAYAEDFRTYEHQLKDALGRDGGKPILHMDEGCQDAHPMIFVPAGSWIIP